MCVLAQCGCAAAGGAWGCGLHDRVVCVARDPEVGLWSLVNAAFCISHCLRAYRLRQSGAELAVSYMDAL